MYSLNCKGKLVTIDTAIVMGIINLTPDSFYADSRKQGIDEILHAAEQMLKEGATILDLGGQSTRPGSERISAEEELTRVVAPIEKLARTFPDAIISIDTYFARVAREAVEAGASLVNDISGGTMDADMLDTVARLQTPYVCTHMLGEPTTMQQAPQYKDVVLEVLDYFIGKIKTCRDKGIRDIIIDPGFGFGKTISHNFQLLRGLKAFNMLDVPTLAGLSRKGTVYKTLGIEPHQALNGSTVLHTLALANGASILRVHDVRAAMEAITLFKAYNNA